MLLRGEALVQFIFDWLINMLFLNIDICTKLPQSERELIKIKYSFELKIKQKSEFNL